MRAFTPVFAGYGVDALMLFAGYGETHRLTLQLRFSRWVTAQRVPNLPCELLQTTNLAIQREG
jgi:hypothetical protein